MTKKKIDFETILACKAGDSDALNRVLAHYEGMINAAASRTVRDEYGQETTVIDQEVKQNIQQTLMLQIFLKYDHLAEPPKEQKNPAKRKLKIHDVSQVTTCASLPSATNYRWNVLQAGESLISLKEVFSGLQAA